MKNVLIIILLINSFITVCYADKGTLIINTKPGGAKIYIDDKYKGDTPENKGQSFAVKLNENEYLITAEKMAERGSYIAKRKIFVGEDTLQTVNLRLKFEFSKAEKERISMISKEYRENESMKLREIQEKLAKTTSPKLKFDLRQEELNKISTIYIGDPNRPNDFILQGDGTVTDKRTGLQWMLCNLGQSWVEKACVGNPNKYDWYQAVKLSSDFAGYNDWRLPTSSELMTLSHCATFPNMYEECKDSLNPTIIKVFISGSGVDKWFTHWSLISSTEKFYDWGSSMHFYNGGGYNGNAKTILSFVRLVRNIK